MSDLRKILRTWFPAMLFEMAAQWGLTPPPGGPPGDPWRGVDLVGQLLQRLEDPQQMGALVERLPPLGRTALRIVRQAGPISPAELCFRMVVGGFPSAESLATVERLLVWGLIVPQGTGFYGIRKEDFLRSTQHLATLAPGVTEIPVGLVSSSEHFPAVDPKDFGPISPGDASPLGAALLDLLRIAGSRRIKLTKRNWLPTAQKTALAKQISNNPLPEHLVELALVTGLLQAGQDGLVPGPKADRAQLPLSVFLAHCFWESLQSLREEPEDEMVEVSRREARVFCAAVLTRVEGNDWFSVDALMDRLISLQPTIGYAGMRESSPDSPHRYPRQLSEIVRFLLLFGRAFGIVDLAGVLQIPSPRPGPREHARLALRVTPMGRAILRRLDAPSDESTPVSVLITPDFEVVVPTHANRELHFLLGRACVPLGHGPQDPVRRYRFERERWGQALQSGIQLSQLRQVLEEAAGRPLPANVAATLESWSEGFGGIRLLLGHVLIRFDHPELRDGFVATHPQAQKVGEQDVLLPRTSPAVPRTPVIDYLSARLPSVSLSADGQVRLLSRDLLLNGELEQLCVREEAGWRMTQESLQRSGWKADKVKKWLSERGVEVHPRIATLAMGWTGGLAPATLLTADLLQLEDETELQKFWALQEFRDLVLGLLPPTTLVLKPGSRPSMETLLRDLRVRLEQELRLRRLEATES